MAQKMTNKFTQLPQDVTIVTCTDIDGAYMLDISFPEDKRVCPECGSVQCIIKDSGREQIIRHVSTGLHPVFLKFHKKRYLCKDCSHTFYQHPSWLHPTLRMTTDLFLKIRMDLAELLSISQIAAINHVPEATVLSVLNTITVPRPDHLPGTLCCDEFNGDAGIWDPGDERWRKIKLQCSIASGESGYILDILPGRKKDYLSDYFRHFPKDERDKVEYFCCDMSTSYTGIAKKFFPKAIICIDMFHVINHLNKMLSIVRRRLQDDLVETDHDAYKKLKNSRYLLLTKETNQDNLWGSHKKRNLTRLNEALSVSSDLRTIYDAVQEFHGICGKDDYTIKRMELTDWIRKHIHSEVTELASAAHTMVRWRTYIENSWKYNRSNGPIEGLHNKIKVLKRISFGIHEFESFRKRILLVCGPYHLHHAPVHITDIKRNKTAKGGK